MLRTVPLAEEYCKKTIRHLAGEPRPHPAPVARPRGRQLHVTGGPHKEGRWCYLARGWTARCGDPLWVLETQVPPDPWHYP